jgi:transketolase
MDETSIIGFFGMKWNEVSALVRADVIEMSHRAKTAHLASALSCVDILTVIYTSIMELNQKLNRKKDPDKFILSKGHAATALYAMLSYKGIINRKDLLSYGKKGSFLEEHPSPKQKGVEAATGSLGHGLPIANGIALANKIRHKNSRVFVLMSDGECNEGSVWEAAMFAAQHKLQ